MMTSSSIQRPRIDTTTPTIKRGNTHTNEKTKEINRDEKLKMKNEIKQYDSTIDQEERPIECRITRIQKKR